MVHHSRLRSSVCPIAFRRDGVSSPRAAIPSTVLTTALSSLRRVPLSDFTARLRLLVGGAARVVGRLVDRARREQRFSSPMTVR